MPRPFVVESKLLFKAVRGEQIERDRISGFIYVLIAYDVDKRDFLFLDELSNTLLYKNYLSLDVVSSTLEKSSRHLSKEWNRDRKRHPQQGLCITRTHQ
ncbi:hypothetical protein [Desulfurococcus amylolyticus]|nr:hypothetical protein [Desulfurococcus amylolyticus]